MPFINRVFNIGMKSTFHCVKAHSFMHSFVGSFTSTELPQWARSQGLGIHREPDQVSAWC